MFQIIPFRFENLQVRTITGADGEPWLNANDVCAALEMGNPRQAVESHVDSEDVQKLDTPTAGGHQAQNYVNESGLYALIFGSTKDAAKRFKKWVTSEVLPAIRKTGSYQALYGSPYRIIPQVAVEVAQAFPTFISAAKVCGFDQNMAVIGANQALLALSGGTNLLQLMGQTHLLAAPEHQVRFYTPTELGQRIGVSGREFNKLLAEVGLQVRRDKDWEPLPSADGFFRLFDTGKKHGSGTPVQQLKWVDAVMDLVNSEVAN